LFQEIARKNVETFRAWGVSEIVALCPHCYNTLKNEYPDFGAKLTVRSSAEWLDSLIDSGKLRVRNAYSVKATYHDPCYLGRINSEVEPPRNILRAIRGLDVVEMSRSRDQTLCCGAGGGHLWLRESGKRISSLRAGLCIETRADLVAAACPYCLIMLDDGIRTMHTNSAVAVMDLAEIVELVTRGPLDGGQDACPTRR
jgi:Fe-S oxidoreductase